jgi:hypothetical protein
MVSPTSTLPGSPIYQVLIHASHRRHTALGERLPPDLDNRNFSRLELSVEPPYPLRAIVPNLMLFPFHFIAASRLSPGLSGSPEIPRV